MELLCAADAVVGSANTCRLDPKGFCNESYLISRLFDALIFLLASSYTLKCWPMVAYLLACVTI